MRKFKLLGIFITSVVFATYSPSVIHAITAARVQLQDSKTMANISGASVVLRSMSNQIIFNGATDSDGDVIVENLFGAVVNTIPVNAVDVKYSVLKPTPPQEGKGYRSDGVMTIHSGTLSILTINGSRCGDGNCEIGAENFVNCPADCAPACGDNVCARRTEGTPSPGIDGYCEQDCGICGDYICTPGKEDATNCPVDCGVCGDGICGSPRETLDNCPQDCTKCGDGYCTGNENTTNCLQDCTQCGDGICIGIRENAVSCPQDCTKCGDGICNSQRENLTNCPQDCKKCGDNICTNAPMESPASCPSDCQCGDGICTPPAETSANCPGDCGVCGDGFCLSPAENLRNCPLDCGYCGDGVCSNPRENKTNCSKDCGGITKRPAVL